ncbi:MAG: Ger(x)C family spore germination protein [Provencibacterium sp.]|nr:Ger(x)C family spore germination protein [Provencibacterium sp.]
MKNRLLRQRAGKHSYRALLLIACLFPLLLTGCMHAVRLKDRAIVQAVGIDWEEGEYRLTFQYFVPEGSGGATAFDASKLNNNVMEASGPTLTDAISKAGRAEGKQLFFGSNRIVVLGREMMEHDINSPISYFNSQPQIHPGIYLMAAEGSAREIVSAQIARGIVPASAIEQAAERGRSDRFMHGGRLLDIVMQLQSETRAADLPLIYLEGNEEEPEIHIGGSALCKDGRQVDTLTDEEVLGALWITGRMEQSAMSLPLEGDTLCALKILGSDARLHPEINAQGEVLMKLEISVHSAVQETIPPVSSSSALLRQAREAQEQEIRRLAEQTIQKTIYQNGADILGLGKALRKFEPGYYQSHAGRLEETLKSMRFDIKIVCNIGRIGLEAGNNKR